MDKQEIAAAAGAFVEGSELGRVHRDKALRPDLAGLKMFGPPLTGFAAARDPMFEGLRRPGVVGPHFRLPGEWLPGAETVISFFLPFTEQVVVSNREDPECPSPEWLHARIEGQELVDGLSAHLVGKLEEAGHRAVAPSISGEFWSWSKPAGRREDGTEVPGFTSNWSERHVAHVAGLGTFGVSAAIITERGSAGRLCSVVTTLSLEPDARRYRKFDEYCIHCGACADRCFVHALALDKPKDKAACKAVMNKSRERDYPRYGCAKCNVAVPCETAIP